jgi:hypothetical protein
MIITTIIHPVDERDGQNIIYKKQNLRLIKSGGLGGGGKMAYRMKERVNSAVVVKRPD